MQQQDLLNSGSYNINQQNLPNATVSLVLGILSIVGSICYGTVGIICGIIGLVLANKDRKLYQAAPELYLQSSYSTLNAGRTCSIIGIILSLLFIIVILGIVGFIFFTKGVF